MCYKVTPQHSPTISFSLNLTKQIPSLNFTAQPKSASGITLGK
jgi:hypothetical protein